MTQGNRTVSFSVLVAVILALASGSAWADMTKVQCVDADTKGQDLRRDGKLSTAREQLRMCAALSCPAMVRNDCTERLDELERAQPTMAFEVKSPAGADLVHVRVSVDGQPIVDHLDGKPLNLDPGAHLFTFEAPGLTPIARRFVLTEGQKGRQERITMIAATAPDPVPEAASPPSVAEAKAPPPSATASAPIEPSSANGGMGTQKIFGLVAGAVGIAGIAVGSVFGLMTLSEKSQQQSACGSSASCTSSGHAQAVNDHSTGMTDSAISTVGFIAGGALLVASASLFFTAGHAPNGPAAARTLVVPSVVPGGAGMIFRGRF
jgi:hypothetical protein